MNRKDFEAQISARAAQDEEFRKQLLADPRGTLSKALEEVRKGASIPDNVEVVVVEETPNKIYIVIPPASSGNLSEDQLAGISGGTGPTTVSVTVLDNGVVVSTIAGPPSQTVQFGIIDNGVAVQVALVS